jgi:hypothetical protein
MLTHTSCEHPSIKIWSFLDTIQSTITEPCFADVYEGLAEREGFEPPVPFRAHLISSQAPSAGLGHLSAPLQLLSRPTMLSQFLSYNVIYNAYPKRSAKPLPSPHPSHECSAMSGMATIGRRRSASYLTYCVVTRINYPPTGGALRNRYLHV